MISKIRTNRLIFNHGIACWNLGDSGPWLILRQGLGRNQKVIKNNQGIITKL